MNQQKPPSPPRKRTKPSAAQAASPAGDGETASDHEAGAERIAKVLARAGLCSRRDAERWIEEGRVAVNGEVLASPAVNVTPRDRIVVDGKPLPQKERTRLWLYHKPRGLVTTARDPQGRPTVFDAMPESLPRVIAVGRLDINTEGLLLLTNDGGLARLLELPSTGWLRRYRVRAWGEVLQPDLDKLQDGIEVEGVMYGAIEATLDRVQGANNWITIGLREGKNREVKNVLSAIGLDVNRLIRISYGPFQLGELAEGEVLEIRGRVLRDQLGAKLIRDAGLDFDAPLREEAELRRPGGPKKADAAKIDAKPNARSKTRDGEGADERRAFTPRLRSARPVTGRNRDDDRPPRRAKPAAAPADTREDRRGSRGNGPSGSGPSGDGHRPGGDGPARPRPSGGKGRGHADRRR